MRRTLLIVSLGLIAAGAGCQENQVQTPPRVPVAGMGNRDMVREEPPAKPLVDQPRRPDGPMPFNDPPLLVDQPPESKAFVQAWNRAGKPRILLFVNRTLEGHIIPAHDRQPDVAVERVQRSNGTVSVERRESDGFRHGREDVDRFETKGPGEFKESTEIYLKPGEYDEVRAKAIDYELIENLLTDTLASDNQVEMVSPTMARKRLTDEQVKDIQSGRPQVLSEIAKGLDCQFLIQVQARPTRQTREGLEVRVIAEVIDIRTGGSAGRAAVDVPPPLDKIKLNTYTRFLARKLMDGMIMNWQRLQGPLDPPPQGLLGPPAPAPMPRPVPPLPGENPGQPGPDQPIPQPIPGQPGQPIPPLPGQPAPGQPVPPPVQPNPIPPPTPPNPPMPEPIPPTPPVPTQPAPVPPPPPLPPSAN